MEAKEFWAKVDRQLQLQGLTVLELSSLIGKSRNTIYSQKTYFYMPKADQIKKMEEVLGCKLLDDDESFSEFLPYLRKAEEWQLRSIRQILGMPAPPSKEEGGSSMTKASL